MEEAEEQAVRKLFFGDEDADEAAWTTLTNCFDETERGVIGTLFVEDKAASVGERGVVRRCWKRVGKMGPRSPRIMQSGKPGKFSEFAFEKYWEKIKGKEK